MKLQYSENFQTSSRVECGRHTVLFLAIFSGFSGKHGFHTHFLIYTVTTKYHPASGGREQSSGARACARKRREPSLPVYWRDTTMSSHSILPEGLFSGYTRTKGLQQETREELYKFPSATHPSLHRDIKFRPVSLSKVASSHGVSPFYLRFWGYRGIQ